MKKSIVGFVVAVVTATGGAVVGVPGARIAPQAAAEASGKLSARQLAAKANRERIARIKRERLARAKRIREARAKRIRIAQAKKRRGAVRVAYSGGNTVKHRRVIAESMKLRGKRYRWGATGPHRFDCSGFTRYVHRRAGKSLPRTAHQQYRASKKIGGWSARNKARPGDLVFWKRGGHVYHVEVYLGNGRSIGTGGKPVAAKSIWGRGQVVFGRVM